METQSIGNIKQRVKIPIGRTRFGFHRMRIRRRSSSRGLSLLNFLMASSTFCLLLNTKYACLYIAFFTANYWLIIVHTCYIRLHGIMQDRTQQRHGGRNEMQQFRTVGRWYSFVCTESRHTEWRHDIVDVANIRQVIAAVAPCVTIWILCSTD